MSKSLRLRVALRIVLVLAAIGAVLFAVVTNAVLLYVPYRNRIANEHKALNGDVAAERHEGHAYEFGGARVFGYGRFAPSLSKAEHWYEMAAKAGDKDAAYSLAQLYELKFPDSRNADALKWYLAAANQKDYDSLRRLADIYENGELDQAPDAHKASYWRVLANALTGLPELRHNADILDSRRQQFQTVAKILATTTDRGAALTGYLQGKEVQIADLQVGLSNKDVVEKFYYDHGHLFFVREINRYFSYSEKTGEFDFTRPSHEIETDVGFLPSGKVVGGDTPDPSEDRSRSLEERASALRFNSNKSLEALHTQGEEVEARDWIP